MEKNLLKTPEVMHDFIYNLWIFLQMNSYDGDGRKTPKYIQKQRNKGKNPPFGWPPIPPPSIKLEADCFPGRKNRKQVGPALGGTGILIYKGKKKNKGLGTVWVDTSR